MKKRILIIFSGVFLVGLLAAGSFKYYIKPNYVAPALTAMEELLEDDEMMDLILEEYAVDQDILDFAGKELKDKDDKNSKDNPQDNSQADPQDKSDNLKEKNKQVESKVYDKENKKDTGGGKTVAELQKQVKPSDLSSGLRIASKVDTGYLMGLYRAGLTPENKSAAKSHLTSRLTAGEISELRGLFGKYSYLLK